MIARCVLLVFLAAAATACPLGCGGYGRPVFRVALDNCGPAPLPLPVINAGNQIGPVIEKPVIPLPACIPAPKTINNVCSCVKTIVKPQVYQQLLSVPAIQRYLQTTHTPVVENIQYEAVPINCAPYAPEYPALPACLPALPPCLPALPPCLPALPPCLPALPPCLPALPPCLPALPPCLPAFPRCGCF